jgi:hypothetical protein
MKRLVLVIISFWFLQVPLKSWAEYVIKFKDGEFKIVSHYTEKDGQICFPENGMMRCCLKSTIERIEEFGDRKKSYPSRSQPSPSSQVVQSKDIQQIQAEFKKWLLGNTVVIYVEYNEFRDCIIHVRLEPSAYRTKDLKSVACKIAQWYRFRTGFPTTHCFIFDFSDKEVANAAYDAKGCY